MRESQELGNFVRLEDYVELEADFPDIRRTLTAEQARLIMDAHEIEATLGNEEESDLLEANNPELLHAYLNLQAIADGSD